ncbi:hypothetical protein KVT40_001002 [Elsinoe batatas]|uniref:Uncharacterized protein n=1 Tax=Elsinoe batatas TaxID=2601811 RepID=A0A8K0PKT7_9PEZI|nr:hypothetical protein KVT40_001002 [Elsinoe batatas]
MDPRRPPGPPTAHMYGTRSNELPQTPATGPAPAAADANNTTPSDGSELPELPDAPAQIVNILTGHTLSGLPWDQVGPAATDAFVARYRDLVSDLPLTMNTVRILVVSVLTYKGEIPERVYTDYDVRCIAALYLAILRSQMLVGRMGGEARTDELPSIAYANLAIRSAIDWGLGDLDTNLGPPVVTIQNVLEATAFVRHRQTSRNDELARKGVLPRNDLTALQQARTLLETTGRCKPGSLPPSRLPPPRIDAIFAWVQHQWMEHVRTQGTQTSYQWHPEIFVHVSEGWDKWYVNLWMTRGCPWQLDLRVVPYSM